ncbi:Hypothetical predicted protein [Cloeon dipterum]|uniref:Uncharacterized protein n=1 Tax=Cloeon dipterum TaxID=197152 RepID=A0A8S1E530_9INSE|nr:Hypothetical predicted protein [Cloeon dipterum]
MDDASKATMVTSFKSLANHPHALYVLNLRLHHKHGVADLRRFVRRNREWRFLIGGLCVIPEYAAAKVATPITLADEPLATPLPVSDELDLNRVRRLFTLSLALTPAVLDVGQRDFLDEVFATRPGLEAEMRDWAESIVPLVPQYLNTTQQLPERFADIPRDVRLLDKAVWVACNLFTVPGLDLPSPAVMETMMTVISRHTYLLLALNAKLRRFGVDNLVDLSHQNPKFRTFAQLERYSRFNEMPADLDRARAEVLDDHMRRLMAVRRRSDVAAGRATPVVQPDVPMRRR